MLLLKTNLVKFIKNPEIYLKKKLKKIQNDKLFIKK